MQNNRKEIGTNINAALALRDKTQKELAEHIKVKPNVISYFCKGERTPNTEQLILISKYLDVSADFLLGLSKNPTLNEDYQNAENLTGLSETAINKLSKWSKNQFSNKSLMILCELLENDRLKELSRYLQMLDSNSSKYIEKATHITESSNYPNISFGEIEDLKELNMICRIIKCEMSDYITELQKKYDRRENNPCLKYDCICEKLATDLNTDQKGE